MGCRIQAVKGITLLPNNLSISQKKKKKKVKYFFTINRIFQINFKITYKGISQLPKELKVSVLGTVVLK